MPSNRSSEKPLVWLRGEVKTPPFSRAARIEAGVLLRRLQHGDRLDFPHSRPMQEIGPRCHELRIPDETCTWRVVYRLDADAIIVADVFSKKTGQTPDHVLDNARRRLRDFDRIARARKCLTWTGQNASVWRPRGGPWDRRATSSH